MNATQTATSGTELPPAAFQVPISTSGNAVDTASPVLEHPGRAQAARPGRQHRIVRLVIGLIALTALVGLGARWWYHARLWVSTDNAYVSAHVHTVSARVAGTVKEVLVEENQAVTPGTVLALLDPSDLEVKQEQALAQLAQARAQYQQAEAQISQAKAQIAREQARAGKAQQDLTRAESLFQGTSGAISRQEFEQAKSEADAAQANVQAAQSALGAAEALAAAAQAQEQIAQANLREAELQLSYTKIRAPAAGRIGKRNLETGNRIQPGQALLALVQPDLWITANFKETQLAQMRPGQPVIVKLDAFPGRTFFGRVDSISPASGAQFALLPPDNATGNFTKIVQRVPVKIVFDENSLTECEGRVVSGMSAVVEVKTRE